MKLGQYRVTIFVIILAVVLIAFSPLLASLVELPDSSEKFTELWLLGPEHTAENYPFNVTEGEDYNIFVNLKNHMGSSEDYKIYVKFGNNTQINFGNVSSLPVLYEFRALLDDEESWESPMNISFQNTGITNSTVTIDNVTTTLPPEDWVLTVEGIRINDAVFPVDASTTWDSESSGFYFRLSFELWSYDEPSKDFSFDDRVVGLRLNMTSSEDSVS